MRKDTRSGCFSHTSVASVTSPVRAPFSQIRYPGMSVRISLPGASAEASCPGSRTSTTGHGFGLGWVNRRTSKAHSAGTEMRFAWTSPGAIPEVGPSNPARMRARASAPAARIVSMAGC